MAEAEGTSIALNSIRNTKQLFGGQHVPDKSLSGPTLKCYQRARFHLNKKFKY